MKYYLLVYTKELGTRPAIKNCLDNLPGVVSWRSELPNSFFIQSELDAFQLSRVLHNCLLAPVPRFLLTELHVNSRQVWGWLTDESWDFIGRTPEPKTD